jgi:mono/diheme cytochrome c family protein
MRLAAATMMMVLATPAFAQMPTGDAMAGRAFAERVCAQCHAVQRGEPQRPGRGAADAPSFATIAGDPASTELRLRVVLRNPHSRMPDLILTERETDDVITYIHSLRR